MQDVIINDEVVAEECSLRIGGNVKSPSRQTDKTRTLYFMFLNKPPTVCATISMMTLIRSLRCMIT